MSLDLSPLLRKVAELADELDRSYGPEAIVGEGIVAVEVLVRDADTDEVESVSIEHRCTAQSTATAVGLAALAMQSLTSPFDPDEEEPDGPTE